MIVTFYSFKGGVGRSFSLVETAVQLARRGRSVVVWDLDLEAPGLQRIPALHPLEERLRAGTVDLLLEFQREYEFPETLLRDALVELDHPRLVDAAGRLSFLLPGRLGPGARGESYAARFAGVDWAKLFDREGGTGVEFFHAVARHLTHNLGFEYVLIDARTGYTDLGILSTLYLPDLVVLVSNLNEQNIQGVADMHRRVTATRTGLGAGNLRALLVANMVPSSLPAEPPPSDEERRRFADERARKRAWLRETLHVEPLLELPLRPERLLLERVPSLERLEHEAAEWTPLVDEIESERRRLTGAAESDRDDPQALAKSDHGERALLRIYGLADFVARPVLLETIVAALPPQERPAKGESISLVALYETYYRRWVEDPRLRLTAELKESLIAHLARMVWNEPDGHVHYQLLAEHLGGHPPGTSVDAQIDYELRKAVFLTRELGGDYSFIHRSFLEFFVARTIRTGLKAGNADALDIQRLTREVAFVLEFWDEANSIPDLCRAVLAAPYRPRVSENALLLLYWHAYARLAPLVGGHEERGETSGLAQELLDQWTAWGVDPATFQLQGADLAGATLPGVPLDDAKLDGANVSRALVRGGRFIGATLAKANLAFADARSAAFDAADLSRANLNHADARGASFWRADLTATDLTFSQLRGALLLESDTTPETRFRAAGLLGARQLPEFLPDAFTGRPTTAEADLALVLQFGHDHGSTDVAWSHDGLCLAVGAGGNVEIWDAAARRLVRTMAGHSDAVRAVAWDASGERVASASNDKTVKVWDAVSGRLLRTMPGHDGLVLSVAWAPNGTLLASASDDKTVKVWDGSAGRLLSTLEGHTGYVTSVAWDTAGERLASGSSDGTARIWDAQRGAQLASIPLPPEHGAEHAHVQSVAWDSAGARLAVACESVVFVWDIAHGASVQALDGHTHVVSSVAWEPGGKRVASGSFDDTVRIWDAESGELLRTLDGARRTASVSQALPELQPRRRVASWDILGIESVAWAPDVERVTAGSLDGTVHVWEASTGQLVNWFQGYTDRVFCVAWDPQSDRLAAGSAHQRVTIWHASSGLPQTTFEAHAEPVECLAWDPGGERLATGSTDMHVKLWDAASGRVLRRLAGHASRVTSVAWEPRGSCLASGSDDSTVKLWDVDSGRLLRTLEGQKNVVLKCVAWEPGGRRLAAGSGGAVIVWDASSGAQLLNLSDREELITSVTWLGTDRLASASYDETVKIWDVSSGRLLRTLEGHSSRVHCVAWDAAGERLASGSADGTVKVWEPSSGSLLWTLQGHAGWISSVAWDSAGMRIVAGCSDGGLWVWDPVANSSLPLVRLYPGLGGHALAITGDARVAATDPRAFDLVRFADRWALYDVTDVPSRVIPFERIADILKRR